MLWHPRLLGAYAQDHKFSSEESCRAIHRFAVKCGGRVEELVIDQDSVFVTDEIVNGNLEATSRDCGGELGPNPSYAASRPKSLRYCMGLLQSRSPFVLTSLCVNVKQIFHW